MSYSLDVNILLFASNRDAPLYAQASAFLEQCARSPELLYLSPPVVMGYLRISTHTRVFAKPLTPQVAEKNVQMLLDLPQVRWLDVGAEAWEHYRLIATQQVVRANLVPDAYIAALLRSHGIRRFYTHDRDFRRFDFLETIDPFVTQHM